MQLARLLSLMVFGLVLTRTDYSLAQGQATIPFANSRLPSDDLVFNGKVLRSDEAYKLSQEGWDLSLLNPTESAVWNPKRQKLSEQKSNIEINAGDVVDYRGSLLSASGLYRFNITKGGITAIGHLDKTLHTMLLRQNILKLMGYIVPEIKWLKNLTLRFANAGEMKDFLNSQIPRATLGASSRWASDINEDAFTVVLHDIAVTVPSAADHYNLAMGTPPQTLNSRTLRALIVPYALLDLGESANTFEWTVGRISDESLVLPHFTRSQFSTTYEDAKWALNIIKYLSVEEIKEAVDLAYFPQEVATLLVEKLISRRNNLLKVAKVDAVDLPVNTAVSSGERLQNGKLLQENWEGYGSRFAYGDPESPFKDYHWFVLSKLQSIVIDNLLSKANAELSLIDVSVARNEFALDQFYEGLDHFIKTGEFMEFPVRTWFSPTADAQINVSRDIVIGNYLGTDNLVQMADSVGWTVRVGAVMGVENVPNIPSLSATANLNIVKTWSHLKPLRNLKQAMQEPYKNMAVPLIKYQLKENLIKMKKLGDSKNPEVDWNLKDDNSELSKLIKEIGEKLAVGESLLYSETITPGTSISGSLSQSLLPVNVKARAAANITAIRRVQIYRQDKRIIQVYDDKGKSKGWTLDATIEKYIPIIRLGFRGQDGLYQVRQFEVNIDSEIKENPKLFDSAHALGQFIQTGSSELLEAIQKPNELKANFDDSSSKFGILAMRFKKLKTQTNLEIKTRDDLNGKFVTFSHEKQSGWNWEAFARDVINYGLAQATKDVQWGGNPFQNPAETIGGMGKTVSARFETAVDDEGKHGERFMRVTDRYEGWSISVPKIQAKMREANRKFGQVIFDEASVENAEKLKLFNVSVNLNLYEDGVTRLANLPQSEVVALRTRLEEQHHYCDPHTRQQRELLNQPGNDICLRVMTVIDLNASCQAIKKKNDENKTAQCLTKLLGTIFEFLDYEEVARLLGRENIFVHGNINGFRNGDEVLNDPIKSNTIGKIQSKYWNGPIDVIQRMLGLQSGEFNGYWLRERL